MDNCQPKGIEPNTHEITEEEDIDDDNNNNNIGVKAEEAEYS